MFNGLGIEWASTLLGFVAVALIPVPIFFLKYGARLRAKSKFAPSLPKPPQQQHEDEEAAVGGEDPEKTRTTSTNGEGSAAAGKKEE